MSSTDRADLAADDAWILARHRARTDVSALLSIWGIFLVSVLALTALVAAFRSIEVSGWDIAGQIPRWYLGASGIYLFGVHLPLYVAHGYTRRETTRQLAIAGGVTIVVAAALMTVGFVIERAVYAIPSWPQVVDDTHLYASATAYPTIALEFTLVFAIWMTAGAFVGACFYRSPGLGTLSIPVGIGALIAAEGVVAPGFNDLLGAVPFLRWLSLPEGGSIVVAIPVTLAVVAILCVGTWLASRDVPLRPEPS